MIDALGGALIALAALGVVVVLVGAVIMNYGRKAHERRHQADGRWPRLGF